MCNPSNRKTRDYKLTLVSGAVGERVKKHTILLIRSSMMGDSSIISSL